jgi:hypothetical protein
MDDTTKTERTVLEQYCHALTELTNMCATEVRPELLADALLSGGIEMLRKKYGAKVAVERVRQAARAVVERNPEVKH